MKVTIEQRKFTLRSEYDIFAPGCSYYAQKRLFSFHDKIQLLTRDGRLLVRLSQRWSLFRTRYDFEFSNGEVYRFRCEKFWRGVFLCEGQAQSFRLYQHKRLNYSIFQGDHQIAAFSKNSLKIGKGDRYDIRMNGDANVPLVICLALTVDNSENEDNGASVTYDFGNIGPEDRPFDESWEPN